jgi:uncharacterized cupin superfamily protein
MKNNEARPAAIAATDIPPRSKPSNYPPQFAVRMAGREKRALGDFFGLKNFGVNLTRLVPGALSALRHAHTRQDEFIYILQGHPTLVTNVGRRQLAPGDCAGFASGSGDAHQLLNESREDVLYLEVGDRSGGDSATYPDDDLAALKMPDGSWQFTHKDGQPW